MVILSNGNLENVNQGIAKKRRRALSLQDQGQKESSDIEEGQIVTEKWESSTEEASVSRRDASEGPTVADSVKKRMSQNEDVKIHTKGRPVHEKAFMWL
ncbi:unnamed protein product [Sphenostylis stenocarpa]|uniref:Uncharacterized protein n=1 Tax=Sphenostylis stenocarpa TaxID=92480 RepID=A0AA86VBZ5_9FABA|nr:unnamed protein product [Sphenostylis stenocarpa]